MSATPKTRIGTFTEAGRRAYASQQDMSAWIARQVRATGQRSGELACPVCKQGVIRWMRFGENGRGVCTSDNCYQWVGAI